MRSALRLLHNDSIVDPAKWGGYTVLHTPEQLHDIASREDVDSNDELYLRVPAPRVDPPQDALSFAGVRSYCRMSALAEAKNV